MSSPNLDRLPGELQLAIFRYVNTTTLVSLCHTSKGLNPHAALLLYREIDLSTHSRGSVRRDTENQTALRQRSFLTALSNHPEYASYVRTFAWTLLFGPGRDALKESIGGETDGDLIYPDTVTWKIFESMINIRRVEIGSSHCRMANAYIRNCPRLLFPAATSVRLRGRMNQELAEAVVFASPCNLTALFIDDVQHWGQNADGNPLEKNQFALYHRYQRKMRGGEEGLVTPGPMRGLLTPIIGRTPNLRHLHLRKYGEGSLNGLDILFTPDDEAVYKEWAAFIESVKGTVQHLIIEHSTRTNPNWGERTGNVRPMDARFMVYILPVLIAGNWRCLTRLTIHGVRPLVDLLDSKVPNDGTIEALTSAIGPAAALSIEPDKSPRSPKSSMQRRGAFPHY